MRKESPTGRFQTVFSRRATRIWSGSRTWWAERAQAAAGKFETTAYGSSEELIADPAVDAVYMADAAVGPREPRPRGRGRREARARREAHGP